MATVLITGASRGIGLEYTKQYLADGYEVIATCRSPSTATGLVELQKDYNDQLTIQALDVNDSEQIVNASAALKDAAIDVLICNAGVYGGHSEFGENDKQTWLDTFVTNSIAPMEVCEAFMPQLLAGKDRKIVLMTSKMGSMEDNGSGGSYIYRSSKAALNAIGKSLANDLVSENVIVLLMHPGWVKTDMTGPNAPTEPADSVAGMRQVIAQASLSKSGRFWAFDGKEIPW